MENPGNALIRIPNEASNGTYVLSTCADGLK